MTHAALVVTEDSPKTFNDRLAAYLRARPNVWIDAHDLMRVGGVFAFRTRLSDLRRAPYLMTIENEIQRCRTSTGQRFTKSLYRYVCEDGTGGA